MPVGAQTSRMQASRGRTGSEGQAPSRRATTGTEGSGRDRRRASRKARAARDSAGGSPSPGLGTPVLPAQLRAPPESKGRAARCPTRSVMPAPQHGSRPRSAPVPCHCHIAEGGHGPPCALDIVFASINSCHRAAPWCREPCVPPSLQPGHPKLHLRASAAPVPPG